MKKILLPLFLLIIFCSCEEDVVIGENGFIWRAQLTTLIDDGKVALKWHKQVWACPMIGICNYGDDPSLFEVYQSVEPFSNFKKIAIVLNPKRELLIKDLQNDNAYFYYMVSKRKGYADTFSDTIMVVPNPKPESTSLVSFEGNHTIESVSLATDINKIAYVDEYYGNEYNVSILISNLDGSEPELVANKASEPDWSPDNKYLVYKTEWSNEEPSYQLVLFNNETKTTSFLTDRPEYKYAPVFSPSGDKILYQSINGILPNYSTSIWMMDLITLDKQLVFDVQIHNLINASKPNWIDNDRFLFQGIKHIYIENVISDYKSIICESSINAGNITPIIESIWNEYAPFISPDGKNIAFLSDRSGTIQLWLYNIQNQKFKQMTGYELDEEFWNMNSVKISWIDNSQILFTLKGKNLVKLRID